MTREGVKTIEQKFLNSGDLFGIKFNDGIIGCEVTSWEQIKYAPYAEIGEIASGSSSSFSRLNDPDENEDILYVEKREKKVHHVGIGHSPPHFRRYTNYPEGEVRLRSVNNLGVPTAGSDYGYVDGEDTPYAEPSDVEELLIVPGVHLDFAFHNSSDRASEPVLNIVMREYNIRALDHTNNADLQALKRIVSPGTPIPVFPAGGIDRQTDYRLQDYWKAEPLGRSQIRNK